jgi:uncharacterized membrane protein
VYWNGSALGLLVGVAGGVFAVIAVVGASRGWPWRRAASVLGLGLLLLGLSLSGVIAVLGRALAILSFNPLRWIGVGAGVVGVLLLCVSGVLPRRRAGKDVEPRVRKARATAKRGDDDLDEIEEILRRRGID